MNMKRFVACIISALCLSVLCLTLAACGPDYKPNFVGTWNVTSMTDSTGADLTPTIEQLAAADKHLTLTLADKEDQATFDLAGQTTLTGTWKPTGEDTCAITFEGLRGNSGNAFRGGAHVRGKRPNHDLHEAGVTREHHGLLRLVVGA